MQDFGWFNCPRSVPCWPLHNSIHVVLPKSSSAPGCFEKSMSCALMGLEGVLCKTELHRGRLPSRLQDSGGMPSGGALWGWQITLGNSCLTRLRKKRVISEIYWKKHVDLGATTAAGLWQNIRRLNKKSRASTVWPKCWTRFILIPNGRCASPNRH